MNHVTKCPGRPWGAHNWRPGLTLEARQELTSAMRPINLAKDALLSRAVVGLPFFLKKKNKRKQNLLFKLFHLEFPRGSQSEEVFKFIFVSKGGM